MNVALKVTLKSTVRMLGEACEALEETHKAADKEKDMLINKAQSLAVFAAARVENILAHLFMVRISCADKIIIGNVPFFA